jgi:hypothetical protein
MPPIQPISPVTQDATANISGGASNLTALAQTRMQEAGATQRQGMENSSRENLARMDQEFGREMTGRQEGMVREGRTFEAEQAGIQRNHEMEQQNRRLEWEASQSKDLSNFQVKLKMIEAERDNIKRQGMKDLLGGATQKMEEARRMYGKKAEALADTQMVYSMLSGEMNANYTEIEKTVTDLTDAELAEINSLQEAGSNAVVTARTNLALNESLFENPDPIAITNAMVDGIFADPGFGAMVDRNGTGGGEAIKAYLSGNMANLPNQQLSALRQQAAQAVGGEYRLEGILSSIKGAADSGYASESKAVAAEGGKAKGGKETINAFRTLSEVAAEASLGLPKYRDSIKSRREQFPRAMTKLASGAPEMFQQIMNQLPPEAKVRLMAQVAEYTSQQGRAEGLRQDSRRLARESAELGMQGQQGLTDLAAGNLEASETAGQYEVDALKGLIRE